MAGAGALFCPVAPDPVRDLMVVARVLREVVGGWRALTGDPAPAHA